MCRAIYIKCLAPGGHAAVWPQVISTVGIRLSRSNRASACWKGRHSSRAVGSMAQTLSSRLSRSIGAMAAKKVIALRSARIPPRVLSSPDSDPFASSPLGQTLTYEMQLADSLLVVRAEVALPLKLDADGRQPRALSDVHNASYLPPRRGGSRRTPRR